MPLDPQKLLRLPPHETAQTLTKRDTILYALGVGAHELPFVYEAQLQALPTMATVMAYPGFIWKDPQYGVDWKRIVHGETRVDIHATLPVEGTLRGVTTIGPIFDKGADKGAIVYQTRKIYAGAVHVATVQNSTFMRGDGGFGGDSKGQSQPRAIPDRAPDASHTLATLPTQALIYRLSGDDNPLHIDPAVATAAGFSAPILHGLCTFGVAGRAILALACGNDPARLKRIEVRFSSPVYPGETICTDIWREGAGALTFRATVVERNVVVLNNGYAEHA